MKLQDLRSIVTNMDAKETLPVSVRIDFGDDRHSYTQADVESFHQYSDVLLLNTRLDIDVMEKLMKFRQWLVDETERFQEKAGAKDASSEGKNYDMGHAAGSIQARAKLEELFNYWDCR